MSNMMATHRLSGSSGPSGPADSSGLRLVSALLSTALALGAATPALAVYTTGDNLRDLTHDSQLRVYNAYAPASYDGLSPVALVVDLHGYGSTKEQQKAISGWSGKADALGILVAYPDGIGNSWNAGVCCGGNAEDDVGFIRAMVDAIELEGNVDASHVYVTGLSNGGAMSHRLACEAADVFAAAAPLAFPTPYDDFATECQPSGEIPLLLTMGLTDVVVPYEDGSFGGAVESFDAWRQKNSCGPEPPEDRIDVGGSFCDIDTSCAGSTQVGLCSVRGSAFDPPLDIYSGHILYINDDGLVLPDLIWEFFQTGSIQQPSHGVPALGPLAAVALALSLAAVGAGRLGRNRGRATLRD
jgi:polyhydroxybutyrate depolymerase